MKRILLMICLFCPLVTQASGVQNNNSILRYQEICAKESDPLKRQYYCRFLQSNNQASSSKHKSYKETEYA